MHYRRNMDEEYRRLQRGSDLTRALRARMRSGQIELWKVDLLAAIGYPPAVDITGVQPSDPHYSMAFQKRMANMEKFWRRAARHIPSEYLDYRFEFQFRAALAALNAIGAGERLEEPYSADSNQEVLDTFDKIIREAAKVVLQNSQVMLSMPRRLFFLAYIPSTFTDALTSLLVAIQVYYLSPDHQVISPENSPQVLLTQVMRHCYTVYPIGTGVPFYEVVANELVPWILGDKDPLVERLER